MARPPLCPVQPLNREPAPNPAPPPKKFSVIINGMRIEPKTGPRPEAPFTGDLWQDDRGDVWIWVGSRWASFRDCTASVPLDGGPMPSLVLKPGVTIPVPPGHEFRSISAFARIADCASAGHVVRPGAIFCPRCGSILKDRRRFPRGRRPCWFWHRWSFKPNVFPIFPEDARACERCGDIQRGGIGFSYWYRIRGEMLRVKPDYVPPTQFPFVQPTDRVVE